MKQFLNDEAIRKSEKRAVRSMRILGATAAISVLLVIVLCLLTRTGNARGMLTAAEIVAVLSGWAIIAMWMFHTGPARAEERHLKGLADGEVRTQTGRFTLRPDSFRIPRSVRVRKVQLETEDESLSLNLNEKLTDEMPPDGSLVRVNTVRKFITAMEVLETGTGQEKQTGDTRTRRIFRAVARFFPAAFLWGMLAVLVIGFVFSGITDTDPTHKITIYADCKVLQGTELAQALEKDLGDSVRMVKVHPFTYALFGTEALKHADLYIIPDSHMADYGEWTSAIPGTPEDGTPVYDPSNGLVTAGEYFFYTQEGSAPEIYRLYFGRESVHREDGLALQAAQLLCGMTETESKEDSDRTAAEMKKEMTSDTLYVRKVENLPEGFIFGMDVSSVIAEEKSGVKYYDFDGNEADLFTVLADCGINYIRVRVWNDPYDTDGNGFGGGNCDIATAVEIGKRATAAGQKLLVDFHYSDFWADPGKQMVPRAWKNMEIEDKTNAVYEFTRDCLTQMKQAGVDVGMVQTGNETNGAMCGEKTWMNIAYLMDAGARATREVYPEALVALHFANPENTDSYRTYAEKMNYYEKNGLIHYDVFATSYYPYWHGTLDNLSAVLTDIANTYGKKVMVMETSYAYTDADTDFSGNTISGGSGIVKDYPFTPQGQANSIRNITDTVVNRTPAGIGVVYWEGAWITVGGNSWEENHAIWEKYGSGWASSYAGTYDAADAGKYYGGSAVDNQAFFDPKGRPLESLKVFRLMREGNEIEAVPDALEDVTVICDLNAPLELPGTVNAVMTDDSRREVPVVWDLTGEQDRLMHSSGVAQYTVTGDAGGMPAVCYVSMIEYNYLTDYSFEENDPAWVITDLRKADELYIEDKKTDSLTGSKHMHFWSAAKNSVEFTLEQMVTDLPEGKFRFSASIMGGDCGATEIYTYVKVNGETVARSEPMNITGYNNWDQGTTPAFEHPAGSEVTVGVYVRCEGSGNGAWGKIDDALLNSVE